MKKIVLLLIMLLSTIGVYAKGIREIQIEYRSGRRMLYKNIQFSGDEYKNEYQILVKKPVHTGEKVDFENADTEQIISIDKTYFDKVYNNFLNLNFAEIITHSEGMVVADGETIKITIGDWKNNVSLTVWSPSYKTEERKTTELDAILKDIFLKVGLEEYY